MKTGTKRPPEEVRRAASRVEPLEPLGHERKSSGVFLVDFRGVLPRK